MAEPRLEVVVAFADDVGEVDDNRRDEDQDRHAQCVDEVQQELLRL